MTECIFCRLAQKSEPASIIFETDEVLALMSLFAFSRGHCFVLPKRHFSSLSELEENVGKEIFTQAQRLAQCVAKVVSCEWVQLMMHDDVIKDTHLLEPYHLHLHVLPRVKHQPYTEERPASVSRQELDELATQIRSVYLDSFP